MNDPNSEDKARNREIAENEADRQTVGDIKVSAWAIVVAVSSALPPSAGCCSTTNRARTSARVDAPRVSGIGAQATAPDARSFWIAASS